MSEDRPMTDRELASEIRMLEKLLADMPHWGAAATAYFERLTTLRSIALERFCREALKND